MPKTYKRVGVIYQKKIKMEKQSKRRVALLALAGLALGSNSANAATVSDVKEQVAFVRAYIEKNSNDGLSSFTLRELVQVKSDSDNEVWREKWTEFDEGFNDKFGEG